MPADVFIDTNLLVYAHDTDAGEKHATAQGLISDMWMEDQWPCLSVQVLQELFVNLTRKGVPGSEAESIVSDYSGWRVVENSVDLLHMAFREHARWGLSFWDSLIVAAARKVGCRRLLSEDLSPEQDYDGISVVNPFV
jgi:predicted nucleic acid-binding protein